jgi:hypothetical protein
MTQRLRSTIACAAFSAATLVLAGRVGAQDKSEQGISVEHLIKSGWDIAGYSGNCDSRSSLILFRKPGETYLMQCLAGYDATREHPIFENCYRLH